VRKGLHCAADVGTHKQSIKVQQMVTFVMDAIDDNREPIDRTA
jgi:hypothetical protein